MQITEEFKALLLVVIQLGAILAVVVLYFKQLWPFSAKERLFVCADKFSMWFKIFVACIPAGVIGILFDDPIDALLMKPMVVVVLCNLHFYKFINKYHMPGAADRQPLGNTFDNPEKNRFQPFCNAEFSLKRALGLCTEDPAEQELGASQIVPVLDDIAAYRKLFPEIMELIRETGLKNG